MCTCVCHVILINESCHTHEEVISQIWSSHATQMFMWVCVCVMSHLWMSHVTHMQQSCNTIVSIWLPQWHLAHVCLCVMSHIWMRHVTHMKHWCNTNVFIWPTQWHLAHVCLFANIRVFTNIQTSICKYVYLQKKFIRHDFFIASNINAVA